MGKWIIILLYFTFLTGSFTPIDTGVKLSQYEELQSKIHLLEEDLCITRQENDTLNKAIKKLNESYVSNLRLRDRNIDSNISEKLKRAFIAYENLCGPEVIITSLKRKYNSRSAHYSGNAADIRFDKQGEKFLQWINSKQGKQWVKEHSVKCILEFPEAGSIFQSWTRRDSRAIVNKHATGVHIHISV